MDSSSTWLPAELQDLDPATDHNIYINDLSDSMHTTPSVDTSSVHDTTNPEICNNTTHLSLLLWNARSLNKIFNHTFTQKTDIIAITETWLQSSTYWNEILPSGYILLRNDRDSRGGGVMLAIKDSIVFKQLLFLNDLEIVSVEIEATFVLCLIYHPPNCADQYKYSLLSYLNLL